MEPDKPTYAATLAHRLTTVLLIVAVVFAVYMTVEAVSGGGHDVLFEAAAPLDDDRLPDGVFATIEQRTGIGIIDPTNREQRLALAIDLIALLPWIVGLWLLRGITRSVRDGDPFVAANVRRLRAIGGLLILGVLAVHFAQGALQDELLAGYTRPAGAPDGSPGLQPADADFPNYALVGGLGVLVLAQVFAHGTQLRDDVATTI